MREDRLELPVAPLLGGSAGAVALDDEDLAELRVPLLAVGQLAGQQPAVERAFAARQVARLARRFARARRFDGLRQNLARPLRVLLEERAQLVVDDGFDDPLDLAVAELGLGLSLELRVAQLHADDGHQPLAHVFPGGVFLQVLEQIVACA